MWSSLLGRFYALNERELQVSGIRRSMNSRKAQKVSTSELFATSGSLRLT